MFEHECVPYAPSLIESMRSLGYSFPSAIADLIDNSISASAKSIDIISEPSNNPYLIVLDDGTGMTEDELCEAMRYGSNNPLESRDKNDLGRFGLGLKSASLSQCRKLVVISKKCGLVNGYSWDLDYVIAKDSWVIKGFSHEEILEFPHIDRLLSKKCGTYVLLKEFDRIKEATSNIADTFNKYLDEMSNHLALVFHRFIEDGLMIKVNNSLLDSRDPFLLSHPATQRKKESNIYISNERIDLKPYILPHLSKLSQSDITLLGGKESLKNEQGFYVYRNKRLIIWGTWFLLERKDELNKLARVRVDIPNTLDYMWSIDIKKSSASLPDIIKKNMYNAVYESVLSSEAVHTFRGRRTSKDDIDYIWERIQVRNGYEYTINRNIPQIRLLCETLEDSQIKMLSAVIDTLEKSLPVSSLYLDAAKGAIEDTSEADNGDDKIEKMWNDIQTQIKFVIENGFSALEYYKAYMKLEPFCSSIEIKQRIGEEIAKFE